MAVSSINLFPKKIKDGFRSFWSRGGTNEFYPGGADDQRRFGRGKLARDIAEIMKENRHRMLLGDSRYIYQAFSTVSGAVNQKANYVFGNSWQLKSHSSDKEFAKSVEEDFKKIDRMLDTRGRGFSFRNNVWLASKTIDTDGDFLILLTEDEESGFPKLQFIESHRLGNFEEELNQDNLIKDGPFKGRRIFAGVIVDSLMQPVAYRIKDESRSRGYQDVPANGVIHVANIEWFSQTRGQPTIAAGILDWYDLSETRDSEKISQKVSSALSLIESNETGTMDSGNMIVNPNSGSDGRLQTQLFDSGLIRYIKNGGSLQAHTSARPSDQWLNFTKMIESSAFYALGWRREMLDSSAIGGAGVRAVVSDVNKSIQARCEMIKAAWHRAALYVIAKRAKQGVYDLPDDWYKVSFTKPPQFTVDEGRVRAADLSYLRAGLLTEDAIVEARGGDYETVLRTRAANIKLKQEIAAEFDIDPIQLGTIAQPGDPDILTTAEQNSEDQDENSDSEKQALDFATLKAKFDSYGIGVRAGSITPQISDEESFRAEAGLPQLSKEARDAWGDDGGFRRPITLQSGAEAQSDILTTTETNIENDRETTE